MFERFSSAHNSLEKNWKKQDQLTEEAERMKTLLNKGSTPFNHVWAKYRLRRIETELLRLTISRDRLLRQAPGKSF